MYFTYPSLLMLSICLLNGIALIEISRSATKDSRRSWLMYHLWATLSFSVAILLDDIVYTIGPRPFFILEYPTIMAAAICYGELCFEIAGLSGSKYLQRYRYAVALVTSVWFLWLIYVVFILQLTSYTSPEYGVLSILPIVLFCWPIVVFTRELGKLGIRGINKLRLNAVHDDHQRAMVGFLWGTLLRVISSTAPILLWLYPNVSWEIVYGVFFTNNLLIVSVMVVTYFNYIEKRANLASKITSILSVMALITVSGIVLALFTEEQEMRAKDAAFLDQNSLYVTPAPSGYQVVAAPNKDIPPENPTPLGSAPGVQSLPLPFDFPFFGKTYKSVFVYSDGQVAMSPPNDTSQPITDQYFCERDRPAIAVFCTPNRHHDTFAKVTAEEVIIVWRTPRQENTLSKSKAHYQVTLKPTGEITFIYTSLPEKVATLRHNAIGFHRGNFSMPHRGQNFSAMPISVERDGVWFDLGFSRRQALHDRMLPVALFLIAIIAIIVFLFRPYLDHLLVKPLQIIHRGLGRVNEGRLDHQILVKTKDEFADIAVGFNRMIHSLGEARQKVDEQTELMEAEITYRTIEAAKQIDPDILSKDQVFEQNLRSTIEDNMGSPGFQVAELADAMATSTRQLHRRVVNLTAQTPAALIKNLRLEQGHMLLSAKAVTVSEAAYKVGFRDVSYFTKLFQKKYDITPSDLLKEK